MALELVKNTHMQTQNEIGSCLQTQTQGARFLLATYQHYAVVIIHPNVHSTEGPEWNEGLTSSWTHKYNYILRQKHLKIK